MGREIVSNTRLTAARKALLSPSGSGRPMSRQELADACNGELARSYSQQESAPRWAGLTEKTIGAMERGEIRWPNADYRQALCTVLKADENRLGFFIDRPGGHPGAQTTSTNPEPSVRRRELFPVAVAAIGGPLLGNLAAAMFGKLAEAQVSRPFSLSDLVGQTTMAKRLYQACNYDKLGTLLPPLLSALATEQYEADGTELAQLHDVGAAAYHVAASILLKHGEHPLALLAAERSAHHARASSNPITVASSARIMAHSLASNGHTLHAVDMAQRAAQQLESHHGLVGADARSVYGALVLRTAVAAARLDDRETASILLDEGQRAAARLGDKSNHQWTGFGPSNVLLHRVSVALVLGDAGTAISIARRVDLNSVPIIERKVSLHVDVAQAYTQWGRQPQALSALEAAYALAPQEVRTRPTVKRVISDMIARSRGSDRANAMRFAAAVGIPL